MTTHTIKTERSSSRKPVQEVQAYYETSGQSWSVECIRAAFRSGPVHYCSSDGPWDLKRLAETFSENLVRSWYSHRDDPERGNGYWHELCIRLDDQLYVRVDEDSMGVYADEPEKAHATTERLIRTFRKTPEPKPATFQIVKQGSCGIDTESVRIGDLKILEDDALALHYGEDFPAWHEKFVDELTERTRGLTIFDGPPGTGKTSYLRQLMVQLKDSHRFYFIGAANLRLLRDAEFVDFWASERRLHEGSKMVVILEDAENALFPRSSDNRQEVSLLLSITDGILGEFLKLQVICTINCDIREIDSALLRPGRLLAHRHFSRLNAERAATLAAELGKSLPTAKDYTLAEIFSGQLDKSADKPAIGFGQSVE